jgi:hypothetical protein
LVSIFQGTWLADRIVEEKLIDSESFSKGKRVDGILMSFPVFPGEKVFPFFHRESKRTIKPFPPNPSSNTKSGNICQVF